EGQHHRTRKTVMNTDESARAQHAADTAGPPPVQQPEQKKRKEHGPLTAALISAVVSSLVGVGTVGITYWNTSRMIEEQRRAAEATIGEQRRIADATIEEQRRAAALNRQESNARDLLTDAMAVLALREAWILQGAGSQAAKISEQKDLSETEQSSSLWPRQVEVRAILDEAEWNSPTEESFAFLTGRRAWIVRDRVLDRPPAVLGGKTTIHFPALISSRGRSELCAWIERVALAYTSAAISDHGLQTIRPYL